MFALVNLPEVVKGALFARYSRTAKSLRRLFLDEFVGDLDISGDHGVDATVGLARAEQLYDRVFFEYGDDSVAQLGGVHLACEQASNLLTKVLERGRLMSYMEKSTRYVAYDSRLPNGRYRYFRAPGDPGVARSAPATSATWTGSSTPTPSCSRCCRPGSPTQHPKAAGRLRLRLAPVRAGQGLRRPAGHAAGRRHAPTWASTPAARPTRRCSSGCGPIRCPKPGRTPT